MSILKSMKTEDYRAVLISAIERLAELGNQRAEIELELAKLQQFIAATLNMLPDDQKEEFSTAVNKALKMTEVKTAGLTEAIRKVLQGENGNWFTVAQVRDRLISSAFDFSDYTANPLASISTTLKRMKPSEVESSLIAGVTVYRWKEAPKGMGSPPEYPGEKAK